MRVIIAGASGTVGKAAAAALSHHEVIGVGRSSGDLRADVSDPASVRAMFEKAGPVDAVIACTGHVHFGPLSKMTGDEFMHGLHDKLMGQVNLVLIGQHHVRDNGSFTLTSGVLDRDPVRLGVNASTVNAALAGFVMAAAIEMPRGIRINVVSPGVLEESAQKYASVFPGHEPVSADRV